MEHTERVTRIKAAVEKKVAELKALRLHEKIHAGSMAAFLGFSFASVYFPSARQVLSALAVVASHGFVVGFIAWAWPTAKAKWETKMGTVAKGIVHVLAILTATAVARHQVSMAMGLPAQDFELTVSFAALLLYLPALAFLLSLLLAPTILVGLGLLVVAMVRDEASQERRVMTGFAQFFGAIGLCVYAGQFFQWSTQDKPDTYTAVRLLAAAVDYQPAALYPGIKNGMKVRLHENGIASTVEVSKDGVVVRVWKLEL